MCSGIEIKKFTNVAVDQFGFSTQEKSN